MSKVAKQVIGILLFVAVASLGCVFYLALQNGNLAESKGSLEKEIEAYRKRETSQILKSKDLEKQALEAEEAKKALEIEIEKFAGVNIDEMTEELAELKKARDSWKEKLDVLKKEKEDLLAKLEEEPESEVIYKYLNEAGEEVAPGQAAVSQGSSTTASVSENIMAGLSDGDEVYWAQILKEKTALELELEKLRGNISKSAVEVTELKKKNSDLQLELAKISNEKEDIERQIKYGKDLSNSLSLELARAQNDKKFLNDRLLKMNDENSGLREQIKQLTSTKIALEKSIVTLQDQKKEVERKLSETENVIQGRIDEIWEIKKSLDESFGPEAKNGNQVELPPIVVSSQEMADDEDPNVMDVPGINGNIVSVNTDNNFVIIDIGKDQGIGLGNSLNVYRGAEYVAGLEVIQVREDIAAADIISKVSDIKIGDAVR